MRKIETRLSINKITLAGLKIKVQGFYSTTEGDKFKCNLSVMSMMSANEDMYSKIIYIVYNKLNYMLIFGLKLGILTM